MEPVKDKIQIDRVILGSGEALKITKWVQFLNEQSQGLIKFSKSDVVNSLIRNHAADLSENEIAMVSQDTYEESKWLDWALIKIRNAKKAGQILTLDELTKFRDKLLGNVKREKRVYKKSKPLNVEMNSK